MYKRVNELTLVIDSAICWPFPSKKNSTVLDVSFFIEVDSFTYFFYFSNIARFERSLTRVSVKGFWKCVLHGLILTQMSGKEWLIVHSVCAPSPLPPQKSYLSQFSCHIIKGKEQSSSFVSSNFWGDKAVTFLHKKNKYFFLPLSLPPSLGV